MNPTFPKSAASLVCITVVLLLGGSNVAQAQFLKKLTVEPLVESRQWEGLFKSGNAITLMLGDVLSASGEFQMVRPGTQPRKRRTMRSMEKPETLKEGATGMMEPSRSPEAMITTPAGQYRIRGRVLAFEPETDPPPKDQTPEEALHYRERAEVEVLLDLVNAHTGRSLVKKSFRVVSQEGRTHFNMDMSYLDYDLPEFRKTSMGLALRKLVRQLGTFIIDVLHDIPMEGNLIWVDQKIQNVVINLGEVNGIQVQDVFTVFWLAKDFIDPLNETDLGDKFTRKGVVKVTEVQGHFSRAKIIAGSDLAAGDLVSPRIKTILKARNGKKAPLDHNVIWGAYKGLPSLSY